MCISNCNIIFMLKYQNWCSVQQPGDRAGRHGERRQQEDGQDHGAQDHHRLPQATRGDLSQEPGGPQLPAHLATSCAMFTMVLEHHFYVKMH